ncbi:MAG: hypothetical protein MI863_06080 [Desulfobacterales bacterium]|nr:hypothetical protein [Desulfobacterales bacterium]
MRIVPYIATLAAVLFIPQFGVQAAGISVNTGMTYEAQALPGSAYTGIIRLSNHGDRPSEVRLYQTDYFFTSNGDNRYDPPGSSHRSNAKWLRLATERLMVPPGEATDVGYRVQVPDDPSLKGSYWSMIMVEGGTAGENSRIAGGFRQKLRYGLQMITQIRSTGSAHLEFLSPALRAREGRRLFFIDIRNAGEIWHDPEYWLALYDARGQEAGKVAGQGGRVFPGTSVRVTFDLTGFADGLYKVLAVADCGNDYLFGAKYTLKLK